MKKLKPEDIEIKSPGIQAKEHIEEKYYTVENFCEAIDMDHSTVYQYLRRTDLGSGTFKDRFAEALDADLKELILDRWEQIIRFVDTIFYNYSKYTTEEDLITFEKVTELCEEANMHQEKIRMKRNKAMYYFKNGRTEQAIEMLKEIIDEAYKKRYFYHWLYFNCDLSVIYGYNADNKKAEEIHSKLPVDDIQGAWDEEEFKNNALYKHYYHYGVICNRIGQHDKAKMLFTESLKYAQDDMYKGIAIVGIGLSHKKKDEYDIALDYYSKALDIQKSVERRVIIYNNMAEVYKAKEEYDTAIKYIQRAKVVLEWHQLKSNFIVYVTYLELRFLQGDVKLALTELMSWASKGSKKYIPKNFILIGLNSIINLSVKIKAYDNLYKLEDLIVDMIDETDEKAFAGELKKCLGEIIMIFHKEKKREGRRIEKEDI